MHGRCTRVRHSLPLALSCFFFRFTLHTHICMKYKSTNRYIRSRRGQPLHLIWPPLQTRGRLCHPCRMGCSGYTPVPICLLLYEYVLLIAFRPACGTYAIANDNQNGSKRTTSMNTGARNKTQGTGVNSWLSGCEAKDYLYIIIHPQACIAVSFRYQCSFHQNVRRSRSRDI